jgi:hypothetical protein
MKRLLLLLSVIATHLAIAQAPWEPSYYSKSTGSLSNLATWGTNTDGTGTPPTSFSTGSFFNLVNRSKVYELDTDWYVGGKLYLRIGDELKLNGHTLSVDEFLNFGNITGSITSNLILTGMPGYDLLFTTGAADLNNLTLYYTEHVRIPSPLNIYGVLSVETGSTLASSQLTLKSTERGTAICLQDRPDRQDAPIRITTKITVEKYVPARRAWHFINAPVDNFLTSQVKGTVNQSWQEGATTASANPNPNPGFGTHITGGSTADGFDQSPSNTPSIKRYNAATNTWLPVSSTNRATVSSDTPYMIFIRGDRSINLNNEDSANPTSTVLRATGMLSGPARDQDTYVVVNAGFTAITNPFPCQVYIDDWKVINGGIYVWDPTKGGSQGVGRWIFQDTTQLQPWQSVMVYSPLGGRVRLLPRMPYLDYYAAHPPVAPGISTKYVCGSLKINLMISDTGNSKAVRDEVKLDYLTDYSNSNAVNEYDIKKLANFTETLGLLRDGKDLLIERRSPPTLPDTIFLKLSKVEKKEYFLQFEPQYFSSDTIAAYLEDSYLHTSTPVSLDSSSIIQFTINDDVASSASDRFKVIFKNVSPLPSCTPPTFKNDGTIVLDASCGNNDGQLFVIPTSGTPPFMYSKDGGSTYVSGPNNGYGFTNLAVGSYSLRLKDATGCESSIVQRTVKTVYGLPTLVNNDLITHSATCSNNDGNINIIPASGTAPFMYSINGGTTYIAGPDAGYQFQNLAAGTYTLRLKDAKGCESEPIEKAVKLNCISGCIPPTFVNNGLIILDATCANNDGNINIIPTSGTAPFMYSINGGVTYVAGPDAGYGFQNLQSGTYELRLKDANGCESAVVEREVKRVCTTTCVPPTFVNNGLIVLDASCGKSDGAINIMPTSGTAPFMYSINGGATYVAGPNAGYGFQNLPAGTYQLRLKDSRGCESAIVERTVRNYYNCPGVTVSTNAFEAPSLSNKDVITTYPNPNKGQFKLLLQNFQSPKAEVSIYDAKGTLIQKRSLNLTQNTIADFDLKAKAAGLYLIKVVTASGIKNMKVLVQ